ncbi:hypothetical protein L6164_023492 [Bauhinia variegata]|uniref:Uncharacterized protein n=1 Tax=Bauhinia variegata TaxID=167791 RepID=A0ACB9MKD7_BAUVA|nr:hypothetical protein L6164_023492 [Bauhinia variegata]
MKNIIIEAYTFSNYTNATNNYNNFNRCSYAFIHKLDEHGFGYNLSANHVKHGLQFEMTPMVLDWVVGNETCEVAWKSNSYTAETTAIVSTVTHPMDIGASANLVTKETHTSRRVVKEGYYKEETGLCQKIQSQDQLIKVVVGVFPGLGFILLLLGMWWLYKLVRKKQIEKRKEKNFKENGGLFLQKRLSSGEINVEKTKLFSLRDLEKATDNFNVSRVLGKGGQGKKPVSSLREEEAKSLAFYFIICMEDNLLFDTVDDRVMKEEEKEHILEVAILAKRCINLDGKKRHTMKEVTMELERIQNAGKNNTVHRNPEEIDVLQIEAYQPWVADSTTWSAEECRTSSSIEILPLRSTF